MNHVLSDNLSDHHWLFYSQCRKYRGFFGRISFIHQQLYFAVLVLRPMRHMHIEGWKGLVYVKVWLSLRLQFGFNCASAADVYADFTWISFREHSLVMTAPRYLNWPIGSSVL